MLVVLAELSFSNLQMKIARCRSMAELGTAVEVPGRLYRDVASSELHARMRIGIAYIQCLSSLARKPVVLSS